MKLCEKCRIENNDEAAYCRECGFELKKFNFTEVVKIKFTIKKMMIVTKTSFIFAVLTIPVTLVSYSLAEFYFAKSYRLDDEIELEYNKIEYLIHDENLKIYQGWNIEIDEKRLGIINSIGYDKAIPLLTKWKQMVNAKNAGLFCYKLLFFSSPFLVSLPIFIVFFLIYNKRWKKFYLHSDFSNAKERLTAFAFSQNKSEENVKIRENAKDELLLKDKSLGAKGYFHLVTDKEGNVLLIGEKYNTQNLIRTVFGKDINFIEK